MLTNLLGLFVVARQQFHGSRQGGAHKTVVDSVQIEVHFCAIDILIY